MRRGVVAYCLCTAITGLMLASAAGAHPADGYTPKELQPGYGTEEVGMGSEYDINELYFVKPYPNPASLTDAEKYMLAGLTGDGPANARRPWIDEIYQAVSGYYAKTGTMPDEFSADIMRELAADPSQVTSDSLEVFRSPITGRYPMLKAEQFSPGDIYMRPLTETEKRHFADIDSNFQQLWFDKRTYDPERQEEVNVRMISDVFYMRVYGQDGVIHTGLHYMWTSS